MQKIWFISVLTLFLVRPLRGDSPAGEKLLDQVRQSLFRFDSTRCFLTYHRFPAEDGWAAEAYFQAISPETSTLTALVTRQGDQIGIELGRVDEENKYPDDEYWDGTNNYFYRRRSAELFAKPAEKNNPSPIQFFLRTNTDFGRELLLYYLGLISKQGETEAHVVKQSPTGVIAEIAIVNGDKTLDVSFLNIDPPRQALIPLEFTYAEAASGLKARYKNIFDSAPASPDALQAQCQGFYRELHSGGDKLIDCFTVKIASVNEPMVDSDFCPHPRGLHQIYDSRLGPMIHYYSTTGLLPLEHVKEFQKSPELLTAHKVKMLRENPRP